MSTLSVSSTTSTATASTTSSSSASATAVSNAYSTFLTLLTTQLENQDPLNATDPNQFTSELISITNLEGQSTANTTLTSILGDMSSLNLSNGVAYIGKTVETSGSTAPLQSGSAEWNYDLSGSAATVTLTVTDSSGKAVYSTSGDTASGKHSFSWDGEESSGATAGSGTYTLTVSAVDSSGSTVSNSVTSIGQVTGVDTSSGSTELVLGGVEVPLSQVTGIA